MRSAALAALFSGCLAGVAGAQRQPVTLHGFVFDSLRGQPLRDAAIIIGNNIPVIRTDDDGRFRMDSVLPGVYDITAQHPLFDSIGLSGLTVHAVVRTGARDIALAVPSFETLWRRTCRGRAPKDSGIVFGTVRHAAGGASVSNAAISLSWVDLLLNDIKRVVERHWSVETHSNDQGGYAICGVPLHLTLNVRAADDSSASGAIDLAPAGLRIERRDLLLGSRATRARHGTIVGMVTDPSGGPVGFARVRMQGVRETRTDTAGRFMLLDVPTGTRQIEAIAVGAAPVRAVAEVTPGDTAMVLVHIEKFLALDPMRTSAVRRGAILAAEFTERRRLGVGYSRDSTQIAKYPEFLNVFRDIPSLNVQYRSSTLTITTPDGRGGTCEPHVFIDGVPAAFGHLIDLQPGEVGGVEVYPRALQVPGQFIPPGIRPSCGMILVWTQYGFRHR